MVSLAPGVRTDDVGEPKDIAFVLDVSGSMAGDAKIGAAKRALEFFLSALDERDRFTVIPFSTDVNPWRERLVVADRDGIDDATDFVRELKALGGTNIAEALTTALSFEKDDSRPFYVAFITDGRPTVGVTQLGGILELVEEVLEGAKIFALGVGYNVNTHLIDKLAQVSKGVSEYVRPEEDLELTVSDFYAKLSHPALTDISIDFGEAAVHQSYPRILPDLFYGSQIVVIGKYCNPGLHTVVLKGLRQGREEIFEKELQFPQLEDFPSLPRLWAKRRVGHLLDEIRLHGEDQELVDEIVELGKRYGIVTPYTSFLVTEDELAHAPDVISEKQALTAPTGRGAFRAAETLGKMKRDVLVFSEGEEALSIRVIDEKVFYLEESVWVDSEYTEDLDEKVLILWSDEFIDFLRGHPEVGRYVSLGDEVIFTYGKVAYRVRP
jgi:Ca-activated chloride channel family protein